MALPKRKTSKSQRDRRRSHMAVKTTKLVPCPQCHELRLPHTVCPACGSYKGVEVVKIETKKKE
jgi:large subunit ribosomal protein L32